MQDTDLPLDVSSNEVRHVRESNVGSGSIVPVIDRRYPLSEAADALRYFAGEVPVEHRGHAIVEVGDVAVERH